MKKGSPSSEALVGSWKKDLFEQQIFPGFPFRKKSWRAIAFNRDLEGDLRIPASVWLLLVEAIQKRSGRTHALLASPYELSAGTVAQKPQPFAISLDERGIVDHFSNADFYLPEFFMSDGSESWAIWGDSDLTVLGGEADIMHDFLSKRGGDEKVLDQMFLDFGVTDTAESDEMRVYLKGVLYGGGRIA